MPTVKQMFYFWVKLFEIRPHLNMPISYDGSYFESVFNYAVNSTLQTLKFHSYTVFYFRALKFNQN